MDSDRTFVIDNADRARAVCRVIAEQWALAQRLGRPLVVTLEVEHRQRTTSQNARLHALIRAIAQCPIDGRRFGVEAIKEYVRRRFLGTEEIDLPDGTRIERGVSTTTLDVAQFARLMDEVEAWAVSELGIEFADLVHGIDNL